MLSDNSRTKTLHSFLTWLKDVIEWRLQDHEKESFGTLIKAIPLPSVSEDHPSAYQVIVRENGLDEAEQLVFLLSLSPYYIQGFLNSFTDTDPNSGYYKLFLNKSLVNKSNYPTFDTALVLLGGTDINNRQDYYYLFGRDSKLFQDDILELPSPPHYEPFIRSNLVPGQSVLSNILTGVVKGPEFSHDFPATQLNSDYSWGDLIVDFDTRGQLEEVKEWLDYENICRDRGISLHKFKRGYKCLFHGPPGTGKTLAASLVGKLTGHKVYRIDLSSVVSKYIGETEKNLAKVFDRASHGNWILFFDEADALFGKRGTTQNAHDRYANQEVSYLLQRFENYEGVTILASNFKENIDTAFYRRFHSIVSFKKPNEDERLELWKVHLPEGFSFAEDINLEDIARSVKITGAGIYNVMRRSCMKAVLEGNMVISGKVMYDSVKMEFAKENKTLTV